MKKIISIAIFICTFGFYASAGSDELIVLEVQEGTATVKVPQDQELLVNQVLFTEPVESININADDAVKRNAFYNFDIEPAYSFKFREFTLSYHTSYGWINKKSYIAEAGTFEGSLGVSGDFIPSIAFGIKANLEFNLIKNDGMNKVVPGLGLSTSFAIASKTNNRALGFGIGAGTHVKLFISKQLAFIPNVKLNYNYASTRRNHILAFHGFQASGSSLFIGLSLGLRHYF